MTKKPSIKNREWEKERRDRLNAAMEKLGFLMVQLNDTTPLSKIEIVQRAIQMIDELQQKIRDLLAGSNESILKSQLELEEALKILVTRNDSLCALLKKAKITVPSFVLPKVLGFGCAAEQTAPPTTTEHDANDFSVMKVGRPPKHSQKICPAEAPSIATNAAARKPDTVHAGTQTAEIPPARVIKLPIVQSNGTLIVVRQPLSSNNSAGKNAHRFIRPKASVTPTGKVAIPALKRRNVRVKIRHTRNRKRKVTPAEIASKENRDSANAIVPQGNEKKRAHETRQEATEVETKRQKVNVEINTINEAATTIHVLQKPASPASVQASLPVHQSDQQLDNFDPSYPQPAALARPVDLSQDILESLQVPQDSSSTNHGSMSPTAAFLLSFPVVSVSGSGAGAVVGSAGGAACSRTDDSVTTADAAVDGPNNCANVDSTTQPGNILENITSLLTTKDYERFVEDVAKTEQNLSAGKRVDKDASCQMKPFEYPVYQKPPEDCLKTRNSSNIDAFAADASGFTTTSSTSNTSFTFSLTATSNTVVPSLSGATNSSKSLGFYDSLSTIGTGRSATTTVPASNSSTFVPNLYSNALSLVSSSSSSAIHPPKSHDSGFALDTAFTFSLTATTTSTQHSGATAATQNVVSVPSVPLITSAYEKSAYKPDTSDATAATLSASTNYHIADTMQPLQSCLQPTSAHHFGQTATYNPFSFDNVPALASAPITDVPQFTFSLTSSTQTPTKATASSTSSSTQRYIDQTANNSCIVGTAAHTNNTYASPLLPYNFLSGEPPVVASNCDKPPLLSSSSMRSSLPFSVCSAVTPKPTASSSSSAVVSTSLPSITFSAVPTLTDETKLFACSDDKHRQAPATSTFSSANHQQSTAKAHVNWMTSSATSSSSSAAGPSQSINNPPDFNPILPPIQDYQPPAYYPTPKTDLGGYVALPAPQLPTPTAPHGLPDDAFAWSPNKLLDASAASSTLPTLHGDLALNTFSSVSARSSAASSLQHYTSSSSTKQRHKSGSGAAEKNAFSVSNLVDQRKPHIDAAPQRQQAQQQQLPSCEKVSSHGARMYAQSSRSVAHKSSRDLKHQQSACSSQNKPFSNQHQQQQHHQHHHQQHYQYAPAAIPVASTVQQHKTANTTGISNTYSAEALLSNSSNQCYNNNSSGGNTTSTTKQRDNKFSYPHSAANNYIPISSTSTSSAAASTTTPSAEPRLDSSAYASSSFGGGDSMSYNYYSTAYLASSSQTTQQPSTQPNYHNHETDYLGAANMPATHSTASLIYSENATKAPAAAAAAAYCSDFSISNQQQSAQKLQQLDNQQHPSTVTTISHAYPFNNSSSNRSNIGSASSVPHQQHHHHHQYSNNYKSIGDIAGQPSSSNSTNIGSTQRRHHTNQPSHQQHLHNNHQLPLQQSTEQHHQLRHHDDSAYFASQILPTYAPAATFPPPLPIAVSSAGSAQSSSVTTSSSSAYLCGTTYHHQQQSQHQHHQQQQQQQQRNNNEPTTTLLHRNYSSYQQAPPTFGQHQSIAAGGAHSNISTNNAAFGNTVGQYGGGNTSNVSNFNLSTICPEINNDKTQTNW